MAAAATTAASRRSLAGFSHTLPPNVRRKPWYKRAIAYPGDMWLLYAAQFEELDWDRLHSALALPVGAAANGLYLFTRSVDWLAASASSPNTLAAKAQAQASDQQPSLAEQLLEFVGSVFSPPLTGSTTLQLGSSSTGVVHIGTDLAAGVPVVGSAGSTGSEPDTLAGYLHAWTVWAIVSLGLDQWTAYIQFALAFMSVISAAYFFLRSRQYHLTKVDEHNPPRSRNVRRIPAGEQVPTWAERGAGKLAWTLIVRHLHRLRSSNEYGVTVWELNAWDISVFHRNLFCLFSPLQVYVLHFIEMKFTTLPLLVMIPATLMLVIQSYTQHLHDRQLLAASMLQEYNVRFVMPRLMPPRADEAVGDDQPRGSWDDTIEEEDEDMADDGWGIRKRVPVPPPPVLEADTNVQSIGPKVGVFPPMSAANTTPSGSPSHAAHGSPANGSPMATPQRKSRANPFQSSRKSRAD
ncbi:hypothetical protein BC828DRAFT_403206 [Blastocladiella britannica]|nr:hypothetical protein BC828DRAFT_403206 [Blastocladiella britannica]